VLPVLVPLDPCVCGCEDKAGNDDAVSEDDLAHARQIVIAVQIWLLTRWRDGARSLDDSLLVQADIHLPRKC